MIHLLRRVQKRWVIIILIGICLFLLERHHSWKEHSHDKVILSAGARYGIHPALIKAVVWRESSFDPHARGGKGEVGLMQLMPATSGEWAKAEKVSLRFDGQMFDPTYNTRAGTWYLRKLYRRYLHTDEPLAYALADYNAGRANVLKWARGPAATNSTAFVQQIGFPSTRDYVVSVMKRFQHYRSSFPPSTPRNRSTAG